MIHDAADLHVILIEDNPDNMELMVSLLREDVGVKRCTCWASGSVFFKWFRESSVLQLNPHLRRIDLILLDIQVPRENGYEILKKIRADAYLASTKVIAVTANVMDQDQERARAVGFDGFIGKPISVVRFPQQINRILKDEFVWEPY